MGVLTDPINRLVLMLADCRGFQRWVGCDSAAAAARRIYVDGVGVDTDAEAMSRDTMAAMRPYAIIYPAAGAGWYARKVAAANCWNWNGSAVVVLSRAYDETLSISAHFSNAAKLCEPILQNDNPAEPGLIELAGVPGYLAFSEIRVSMAGRTPLEARAEYGDAFDTVLYLEW